MGIRAVVRSGIETTVHLSDGGYVTSMALLPGGRIAFAGWNGAVVVAPRLGLSMLTHRISVPGCPFPTILATHGCDALWAAAGSEIRGWHIG